MAPLAFASQESGSGGGGGGQQVPLPPFKADTEQKSGPPPAPLPPGERLGVALIGLGRLSVEQLLPAFRESQKARVTALVSGSPDKAKVLAKQYGIAEQSIYDYRNMDRLKDDAGVQAVYIVLPNGMHREYVERSAKAGKHILCEKPMATNSRDAAAMVAASQAARVKLMVAYRIQYEPRHRQVREMIRSQKLGTVKLIEMVNVQRQGEPKQWRHDLKLAGGGALPDIGLYCLNTSRYLLGEEPVEISAMIHTTKGDPRFREVEENVVWHMRFPSGTLVSCMTGYDSHDSRRYRVHGTLGWVDMDPAFSYNDLRLRYAHAEGAVEHAEELRIAEKNQFTLEIDHFADCVKKDKMPFTPGEEGVQDHRLMEAIYEAAKTGRTVAVKPASGQKQMDAFRGPEPATSSE